MAEDSLLVDTSGLKARRLFFLFFALPAALVMAFFVVGPTTGDEARLDEALTPILERDYPGWSYEAFSY